MKRLFKKLAACAALLAGIAVPFCLVYADAIRACSSPLSIGYCQSDEYFEFDTQLYYILKGMEEAGLIGTLPDDANFSDQTESAVLWQQVCALDQSTWRVRLVAEGYCSLKEEHPGLDDADLQAALAQEMSQAGVNFLLTMGTNAGLTAKAISNSIPMMNFLSSDAVQAGIVESGECSGQDGLWAVVDPNAFDRSISILLDIFSPKTVGVIYADDPDAYIYSGANVLDKLCAESGVTVMRQYVDDNFDSTGYSDYLNAMCSAAQRLAQTIDVFVMTTSLVEETDYSKVLAPFLDAGVPVYSINSSQDVKRGALMAAEASDYANIGRFAADTLQQFLNTGSLAKLPQIYQTAPYLVINYQTARKIGYHPTFDLALSAIKIYS